MRKGKVKEIKIEVRAHIYVYVYIYIVVCVCAYMHLTHRCTYINIRITHVYLDQLHVW